MTHMQLKWFHTIPVIGISGPECALMGQHMQDKNLFVNVKLNVFNTFVSSCSLAHLWCPGVK